jgi:membrane-bound lytic murein transglycosylase F
MQNCRLYLLLILPFILFASCGRKNKVVSSSTTPVDLKQIVASDTLRVATMFGATSYFLYRDEWMGYDYEMAQQLASNLNLKLKVTVANSEDEMTELLNERKVDLVTYHLTETKALKKKFHFVFPQNQSYQVLVQNMGSKALTDVTELVGKTVMVEANSVFEKRLQSLNEELGGGIDIVTADDSLTTEDLIEMVADKKISYTVAYRNTGLLYKTFYKRLDCRLEIGFRQANGWLVRSESVQLQKKIEEWQKSADTEQMIATIISKYWEKSPYFAQRKVKIPTGAISPYDHLFKKYAKLINWDWKLLAAVAFHESRFDSSQVSWAGAVGLMQLMPNTAVSFGLTKQNACNPEMNIEAGVQYIKSLNLLFRKVTDKEERLKFILAGYNCGPSHIIDAMALSAKYGKNPQIWYNNVEFYLLKKSEPEFYKDPVVKYGIFRGKVTVRYVQNILSTYDKYSGRR